MSDDEYYTVPLTDQAVFGAGLKRKRVPFVPADSSISTQTSQNPPPESASSKYLSIVLPQLTTQSGLGGNAKDPSKTRCEICSLPLPEADLPDEDTAPRSRTAHAASLVHQACLTHSHPPSHLDRNRKGLKYLSSYGWDPDARVGLGRDGAEGRLAPLKAKEKNDTLGLGLKISRKHMQATGPGDRKPVRMDAKGVRKRAIEEKRREEKMREMFWGREDVARYLGDA